MNKPFNKKLIFLAVLLLGIAFIRAPAYNWYIDNWKDHRKLLKKVGVPMLENVEGFYKKNLRYPSLKESMLLMEKIGCLNVKQREYSEKKNEQGEIYEKWANYYCDYDSLKLSYGLSVGDLSIKGDADSYSFGMSRGESRCLANFDSKGFYSGIRCYQGNAFFTLGH